MCIRDSPKLDRSGQNVWLVFSHQLKRSTDDFFKYPSATVQRDVPIFQKKFNALLHLKDTSLVKSSRDVWLLLANIAIALTGLGAIALLVKTIHSKASCGHCLPLFFNPSPEEKMVHQARVSATTLRSAI